MAKFDIKRAYRLLPVNTRDRRFLGLKWNEKYFIDLALPFGLRSAPKIFTRFADVLQHILQRGGPVSHLQHYLDDFFVAGKPDSEDCQFAFNRCFQICKQLGVPLADDKSEGPSTCIAFLSFEIKSVAQEL